MAAQPHSIRLLFLQQPVNRQASAGVLPITKLDQEAHNAGLSAGLWLLISDPVFARYTPLTAEPAVWALLGEHELNPPLDVAILSG
jgi:hypothetical protein